MRPTPRICSPTSSPTAGDSAEAGRRPDAPRSQERQQSFCGAGSSSGSASATAEASDRSSFLSTTPSFQVTDLSPRGQAIVRLIANPLVLGFTRNEIANDLGTSVSWISARLRELQIELLALKR